MRFNSEWLEPLGSDDLVKLAAKYTVARMLERREFKTALRGGQADRHARIALSAGAGLRLRALKADVEMGGTDQNFNLIVGRDIMPTTA